jgi:methylenetetrahydrofolate dehydrogenase (NADP+)/methenyltetrahydrofolate cyclohydrolase
MRRFAFIAQGYRAGGMLVAGRSTAEHAKPPITLSGATGLMTAQMTAKIIDGRALALRCREEVARRVATLTRAGTRVRLDAVIAARHGGSAHLYAMNQGKGCEDLGIEYHLHELPPESGLGAILGMVRTLNDDPLVTAMMVHLPLPEGVDPFTIQSAIDPDKDAEGVNPVNIGNIVYGRSSLVPCTALAAIKMVESTGIELRGKTCVIVGASNIVGKPLAVLLMRAEATVISCNKYTADTPAFTRNADVVIAAAGVPGLVTAGMIRPGAVVVDVGTTRVRDEATGTTRTVGDVDFEAVSGVAGWVSPVPGGVGPMTVSMLLHNVVHAVER